MYKIDNDFFGAAIGAALPAALFGIAMLIKKITGFMISDSFLYICCIGANLLPFNLFLNREKYKTVRGLVIVTLLWAAAFFYYKMN